MKKAIRETGYELIAILAAFGLSVLFGMAFAIAVIVITNFLKDIS